MESIKKFNGLNGSTTTREELLSIIYLAEKEEQFHIAQKLKTILLKNSDASFAFDIETPAFESTPKSMLNGLQELDSSEDVYGLGKPVSSTEIYDMITDLIINTIKKVGHLPWQKEWHGSGGKQARNYATKRAYSGINFMLLNFDVKYDKDGEPYLVPIKFTNPYYLTFNQIKDAKATLKKGSKARNVIYYTPVFVYDDGSLQIKTSDKGKWSSFISSNGIIETDLQMYASHIPVVKYYNVYRADDCTGLKFPAVKEKEATPIESAQAIIDNYPDPPKYTFIGTDAKYTPSLDEVNMPDINAFSKESFYYSTYFHEIIHSTGHSKRLDRGNDTRKRDGSIEDKKAYAFEELVAELGAVFLCSESGILFHTIENSAKYLNGWNKRLLSYLQEDNKMFFKASAQAQKASNWILDLDKDDVPAYLRKKPAVQEKAKAIRKAPAKKASPSKEAAKPVVQEKTKERPDYGRKRKYAPKPEVGKNGQTALFGAAEQPEPVHEVSPAEPETITPATKPMIAKVYASNLDKDSVAYRLANKANVVREYYKVDDVDLNEFLGSIEKKTKESVAITITGGQGSMKTRFCFQLINAFGQNYKVGHASIEEHPESGLYEDKCGDYLNDKALSNLKAPEINNIQDVHDLVKKSDVIIIDSFSKLQEMQRGCELDKDFRKAYDGKLFIIIYQMTGDGKMRGGSKSQFDGDAIAFVEKMPDYKNNYIYWDKNRYQNKNLEELKFNIFGKKLIRKDPEKTQTVTENIPVTTSKFSFLT